MENPVFEGFRRILIDAEGNAVSPKEAMRKGIMPEVGFMRHDGWSLGAPKHLESLAFSMWEGEWTHMITRPDIRWLPIENKLRNLNG